MSKLVSPACNCKSDGWSGCVLSPTTPLAESLPTPAAVVHMGGEETGLVENHRDDPSEHRAKKEDKQDDCYKDWSRLDLCQAVLPAVWAEYVERSGGWLCDWMWV